MELLKPTGGPWGSNSVNTLFVEFLKNAFSPEVIQSFISTYPAEWVELLREFEQVKKSLRSDEGDQSFTLLPGLQEIYKEIKGNDLKLDFKPQNNNIFGIQIQGNRKFKIPNKVICDFIKAVSGYTTLNVTKFVRDQNDLDSIIMVGGFSNSKILTNNLKEKFINLNVFIPDDPDVCVVKGAVIYGWNTTSIQSRRSKKTYGFCNTIEPFKPGIHPERHKTEQDGILHCKNVFATLVRVNEEIPVGKVIKKTSCPVRNDQISMTLRIYASYEEHVEYTDDSGCELIGEVHIPIPDTTGGIDRKVHKEYYFGLTEIKITALDATSDSKFELVCDFLSY